MDAFAAVVDDDTLGVSSRRELVHDKVEGVVGFGVVHDEVLVAVVGRVQ
jgi:hypothetical protein